MHFFSSINCHKDEAPSIMKMKMSTEIPVGKILAL